MTDAEEKLCRDIAELEYPDREVFEEGVIGPWWYVDGYCRPLSRYLTDPAETVRMLKALLKRGSIILGQRTMELLCIETYNFLSLNKYDFEVAIAEAYKAMLEEKAK